MSMLNHFFDYKPEVLALDEKALELCQPYFKQMEDIRDYNQLKMLKAFADTQMSSTDMPVSYTHLTLPTTERV